MTEPNIIFVPRSGSGINFGVRLAGSGTGGGGGGSITSVFGRTGIITAQVGDYSSFYQPLDSDLTAIAALSTTTFGRALLTQADATATIATLGLFALYQPLDSDLTAIAALTTTSYGRALLTVSNLAGLQAILGPSGTPSSTTFLRGDGSWQTPSGGGTGDVVGPGSSITNRIATFSGTTGKIIADSGSLVSDFQPIDSDLTAIAALTTTSFGRAFLTYSNFAAFASGVATGTPSSANFLRGDGTWSSPSGSGDVVGPSSATNNAIAIFDTTTGKLIKDSTVLLSTLATLASPTFTGTVVLPTGTVTSGMILDGTILDADINGSAAIAQSKISGLTTSLSGKADNTITVTGTGMLAGGGDLSTNRTITLAATAANTVLANNTAGSAVPTAVAIATTFKTALSLVKGDVGLGLVTNDAQVKVSDYSASGIILVGSGVGTFTTSASTSYGRALYNTANLAALQAILGTTGTPSSTTYLRGDGSWQTPAGGGGGSVATDAIWTTKGQVAAATGSGAASALTVGSNYTVLQADSGQTTGLKWVMPAQPQDGLVTYIANGVPAIACSTVPHTVSSGGITTTGGRIYVSPIYLTAGTTVTSLTTIIGATAAVAPTHSWICLADNTGLVLATSPDATTTAIASNSTYTGTMGTPYVIPTTGIYQIGFMVAVTTTLPTLRGSNYTVTTLPVGTYQGATGLTSAPTPGVTNISGTPSYQPTILLFMVS